MTPATPNIAPQSNNINNYIETKLLNESNEIENQESFSVYDGIKNLDTSKMETYEYMGAKYSYRTYNDRFFLQPASHPEEVETLILPDTMNGKTVAYAEFDLSGYTNLKNLIMFDDGYYCKDVLKDLHVENLYLPVNFNYNDTAIGLTCDNLYYVGTFDNYWLSTTSTINKLKALNAKHYYYYDWSSVYFDNTAKYLKENENINFEKLPSSACKYAEESFYLVPNYSVSFKRGGATYLHMYTGSASPKFKTVEDFPSMIVSIDPRVKRIKIHGHIDTDVAYDNLELIDARSIDSASISEVKADIVVASNKSNYISLYGKANKLYLTDDNDKTIEYINGTASNINEIYIPDTDSAKAHFKKIIDSYSAKIHYYTELPALEFKFTDNEGENLYKTKNFDADIDYCLKNIDILAYNGETVTSEDYLEDKFALFDLAVSPDIQDYRISFDCGNITTVEDVKSKTIDNLPAPEVDHYTFLGWYLDQDFNNEVTLGTALESNITLYGKFEHNKYTLKFNTAGIGDTPASQTVAYIETLPKLEADNKVAEEWYYDNALTNKANIGDELTESTTLFAKWEDSYLITFNTDNKAVVNDIKGSILSNLPTPTSQGFTFDGWYYDASFTNAVHNGDKLTQNTTLYAKWIEDTNGYIFKKPQGIYTSNKVDAMRLFSKIPGSLFYKDGVDVTSDFRIGFAHGNITNNEDYKFTIIASISDTTFTEELNVTIDNTLDYLGIVVTKSGDIYCGFNVDDYEKLSDIKPILANFIKTKLHIDNPNIVLPNVNEVMTKTYTGSYNNGNLYVLASGVNLHFSNSTTTVDETTSKRGYTSCDSFVITKDMNIADAVRMISPYLLRYDGNEVSDYKLEVTLSDKNTIALSYMMNDKTVISHVLSYKIVESEYSYIAGFNLNYHDSVILINKSKENKDFNKLYKEALFEGYHYVNDLDADHPIDLSKEETNTINDTILRGNGSYYNVKTEVVVLDEKKANTKGAEIVTIKDKDGNELKYVPKEESITEKVSGFFNSIKDKVEANEPLKISVIAVGSILGIFLVYGLYLLIRKFVKWLRR